MCLVVVCSSSHASKNRSMQCSLPKFLAVSLWIVFEVTKVNERKGISHPIGKLTLTLLFSSCSLFSSSTKLLMFFIFYFNKPIPKLIKIKYLKAMIKLLNFSLYCRRINGQFQNHLNKQLFFTRFAGRVYVTWVMEQHCYGINPTKCSTQAVPLDRCGLMVSIFYLWLNSIFNSFL